MKHSLLRRVIFIGSCVFPLIGIIAQNTPTPKNSDYLWEINKQKTQNDPSTYPDSLNKQKDPLIFEIDEEEKVETSVENESKQKIETQEEQTQPQDTQKETRPTSQAPLKRQDQTEQQSNKKDKLMKILELTQQSSSQGKIEGQKEQAPEKDQEIEEKQEVVEEPQAEVSEEIMIKFTNINAVEFINFISSLSGKNFVFKENELQFSISIVSDEPTTVENVMTAFLQELRIHGMSMIEYGDNIVIHKNPDVKGFSSVSPDGASIPKDQEIVTQLFRLNTLNPSSAAELIKSMLSNTAQVATSEKTGHVIVTDLAANIRGVSDLLKNLDSPQGGLSIGQYMVRTGFINSLIQMTQKIMQPIAQNHTYVLVPHETAGSIFIVSTPFLVDKTMKILQRLDSTEGITSRVGEEGKGKGRWELGPGGKWRFRPDVRGPSGEKPRGRWMLDEEGNWHFVPEGEDTQGFKVPPQGLGPEGQWSIDRGGQLLFELAPGGAISPERLQRKQKVTPELPVGHIERVKFHIYKLKYRKGDQIVDALQKIGQTMQLTGDFNEDLVSTINSIQWIEASNSLVFTGTPSSIGKVEQLIDEIDTPLRQVFIEMLILETTVDDSLTYGVQFTTRSGGGQISTAQGNLFGASTLPGAMDTAGLAADGTNNIPDANALARTAGFNLGVIGETLTRNGTQFGSIGALITAIHTDATQDILLTPKVLVEDNTAAEFFVGVNTRFQTEAVSNEEGSIITTNFEFRDVGTTLKVTPQIGSNDVITLEIEQEVSRVAPETTTSGGDQQLQQLNPGPTTTKNKTMTKVHVPDKHFLVMSGSISDQVTLSRAQTPCLGGIPLLGALFSSKVKQIEKRNLMIFINPHIVDTEEEMHDITRRQQNIWRHYRHRKDSWKYEVEEGLDFLNIIDTDCENVCQ